MAYSYGIYDRSVTSYYETNQCYSEVINDLHCIHYMLEDGITQLDGYYGNLSACNLRFAGYTTFRGLSFPSEISYAKHLSAASRAFSASFSDTAIHIVCTDDA